VSFWLSLKLLFAAGGSPEIPMIVAERELKSGDWATLLSAQASFCGQGEHRHRAESCHMWRRLTVHPVVFAFG
jgi:hypothetical protein